MGGACSPASTRRNQFRSTSAMCWTRPVSVKADGGTYAAAVCTLSRPSRFMSRVVRWKSSQLSSVVRSSEFKGGMGRSMVLTGRLWPAGEPVGRAGRRVAAVSAGLDEPDGGLLDRRLVQQHGVGRLAQGDEAVLAGHPGDQAPVPGVDQRGDD